MIKWIAGRKRRARRTKRKAKRRRVKSVAANQNLLHRLQIQSQIKVILPSKTRKEEKDRDQGVDHLFPHTVASVIDPRGVVYGKKATDVTTTVDETLETFIITELYISKI